MGGGGKTERRFADSAIGLWLKRNRFVSVALFWLAIAWFYLQKYRFIIVALVMAVIVCFYLLVVAPSYLGVVANPIPLLSWLPHNDKPPPLQIDGPPPRQSAPPTVPCPAQKVLPDCPSSSVSRWSAMTGAKLRHTCGHGGQVDIELSGLRVAPADSILGQAAKRRLAAIVGRSPVVCTEKQCRVASVDDLRIPLLQEGLVAVDQRCRGNDALVAAEGIAKAERLGVWWAASLPAEGDASSSGAAEDLNWKQTQAQIAQASAQMEQAAAQRSQAYATLIQGVVTALVAAGGIIAFHQKGSERTSVDLYWKTRMDQYHRDLKSNREKFLLSVAGTSRTSVYQSWHNFCAVMDSLREDTSKKYVQENAELCITIDQKFAALQEWQSHVRKCIERAKLADETLKDDLSNFLNGGSDKAYSSFQGELRKAGSKVS